MFYYYYFSDDTNTHMQHLIHLLLVLTSIVLKLLANIFLNSD